MPKTFIVKKENLTADGFISPATWQELEDLQRQAQPVELVFDDDVSDTNFQGFDRKIPSRITAIYAPLLNTNFKIIKTEFLPDNLESFIAARGVVAIEGAFPTTLKKLDLTACQISSFKWGDLPTSLEELNLSHSEIKNFRAIYYPALKILNLSNCKKLTNFDLFDSSRQLVEINLSHSSIARIESIFTFSHSLERLDLSGCENLESINLRDLPDNFTAENLLQILQKLPVSLRFLKLALGKNIEEFDLSILPQKLRVLDLGDSKFKKLIKKFPPELKTIDCSRCRNLEIFDLRSLPQTVVEAYFAQSGVKKFIGKAPRNLKIFSVRDSELKIFDLDIFSSLSLSSETEPLSEAEDSSDSDEDLNNFEVFHIGGIIYETTGFLALDLGDSDKIKGFVGKFPELKRLDLIGSRDFTALGMPNLPEGLKKLTVQHPIKIPRSLKSLTFLKFKEETFFADEQLGEVEVFELFSAHTKEIAGKFPASLQKITLHGCPIEVFDMGVFRDGLEIIEFENFDNLREIKSGNVINSLQSFYVRGQDSNVEIIDAEFFPETMYEIYIQGLANLSLESHLVEKLLALESAGCDVTYPRHFIGLMAEATEILNRLNLALEREIEGGELKSIGKLFERFLSEQIAARGGIDSVISQILPIIEYATRYPQALIWMDKIASEYLEECVNQPVAAIKLINVYCQIAQTSSIDQKLEICKAILAQEAIREFVASGNKNPEQKTSEDARVEVGFKVEAEAENVLYRLICEMLISEREIRATWPGVPNCVAHEAMVAGWVDENFNKAYEKVKTAINKPLYEIAELFCNFRSEIWAEMSLETSKVAFDIRKVRDVTLELVEEVRYYNKQIRQTPPNAAQDLGLRVDELAKKLPDDYRDVNLREILLELSQKNNAELDQFSADLATKKEQEIVEKILKITVSELGSKITVTSARLASHDASKVEKVNNSTSR